VHLRHLFVSAILGYSKALDRKQQRIKRVCKISVLNNFFTSIPSTSFVEVVKQNLGSLKSYGA
jgi:hypothetical protein